MLLFPSWEGWQAGCTKAKPFTTTGFFSGAVNGEREALRHETQRNNVNDAQNISKDILHIDEICGILYISSKDAKKTVVAIVQPHQHAVVVAV